jgi:hypothetical protein
VVGCESHPASAPELGAAEVEPRSVGPERRAGASPDFAAPADLVTRALAESGSEAGQDRRDSPGNRPSQLTAGQLIAWQ